MVMAATRRTGVEYLLPWTWALAKKSVYTEYINSGLLILIIIIINIRVY